MKVDTSFVGQGAGLVPIGVDCGLGRGSGQWSGPAMFRKGQGHTVVEHSE